MFQLQNFSILTDVQFCTEGWGGVYSAVQCGVQWLSQEAGLERLPGHNAALTRPLIGQVTTLLASDWSSPGP